MHKIAEYEELVVARKACHRCAGLTNPADVENGSLDTNHVGPWSVWQGNLDAALMVIGQDWGDVAYFVKNRGRDAAQSFTNRALVELLALAGLTIEPLASTTPQVAFFTNAILCLKTGGMQKSVDCAWFHECRHFLRRQIDIVHPQVVVGLGKHAYQSILASFDLPMAPFREEVEARDGRLLPNGTRAFAAYHCGARIRNTRTRTPDEQMSDWERIRPLGRRTKYEQYSPCTGRKC